MSLSHIVSNLKIPSVILPQLVSVPNFEPRGILIACMYVLFQYCFWIARQISFLIINFLQTFKIWVVVVSFKQNYFWRVGFAQTKSNIFRKVEGLCL